MTASIASKSPTTVQRPPGLKLSIGSGARPGIQKQRLDGIEDSLLLQTVSHDLRSPISAALVLTRMLKSDAQGTTSVSVETRLALIARVELSVRQMDRLLTDVLDSDPMGHTSDGKHFCDVGELVQRMIEEVGLESEHPLEIDLQYGKVEVNAFHVERIVDNLLRNARAHVAPGVRIWVKTAALDNGVLISVEDAGSGVDPKLAETIFQPFQRGDSPRSKGHGLGLSLVYRFAALHGGSAWVEERVNGGASFRVFLPYHPRTAHPGAALSKRSF